MNLSAAVDTPEQLLVGVVASLQSEANEAHRHFLYNFESLVTCAQPLKEVSQGDVLPDMFLEIFNAIQSQHEPQLESSEPTSQRDLPVAVVGRGALLVVLQVQRVDIERVYNPARLFEPHCGAIEVNQHPFVRVEVKGICFFDSLH